MLYNDLHLVPDLLMLMFADDTFCAKSDSNLDTLMHYINGEIKGTVSPDILILFMMSIIKSVLFVWPLIPLSFCYSFFNFIFVYKVLIDILPITLELAHISLRSLANFASDFINHYFFG
jgi:hypothetical protein